MFQWVKDFRDSSSLTKNAIVAVLIWALPVVIMTLYCYARLDFVRSYDTNKPVEQSISK